MDGIAGARNDLANGPSADIANGAPTGTDATNQIVLTWSDGAQGLNHEQLLLMTSTDGGASFTGPTAVPLQSGDRPYYTAPAISPNGTDVYITYNAFTTPYRTDTTSPRGLIGAILHADVTSGSIGAFGTLARGAVGDPRASSQNNLQAEFLGDYVYTAATRAGGRGLERRPQRSGLPGTRCVADVTSHGHNRHQARPAGRLPRHIRQHRHLRRRGIRPNTLTGSDQCVAPISRRKRCESLC
jgi:hypothetical protein